MTFDERLAKLLGDAVSDVEPSDRLADIRARPPRSARAAARPRFSAAGAAAVVTAVVVAVVAVLGGDRDGDPVDHGHHQPTVLVPAYYVGDTTRGPRLFRELHAVPADSRLLGAMQVATAPPQDPDYATYWPPGSFAHVRFDGSGRDGEYAVTLADATLRDRPDGMTAAEARMAVQALIYTVQAAGDVRAPVQFYVDGRPADRLYGVPAGDPLTNDPVLTTLSLVNLDAPADGVVVSGWFDVEGLANSPEANVPWQVLRGEEVVDRGAFTATGWMGERLFPFRGTVDVSDLDPGTYTFVAMTEDPSGGAEGFGPATDTRTIVVR